VIRDAREEDLPAVVEIYNASIPGRMATADTEPVSLEARRAWFHEHAPDRHPLWVFEREGEIAGWLSFGPFYGRPAYAATAEISVYVAPRRQRQGVATALLREAIGRAPSLHLSTLLGFVFAHNAPSVALFHRFGFREWGHLPEVAELDGAKRDLLILGRHVRGEAERRRR
jgi:phosphinothricin acetyltransferase